MKRVLWFLSILVMILPAKSQDENGQKVEFQQVKNSFNKDINQAQSAGQNAVTTQVNLELSKDFNLSGSIKIQPKSFGNFFLTPNFEIGSTNKYTPLFDKGKWAINTSFGLTFGYQFGTKRWFFNDDIESVANEKSLSNSEALASMPEVLQSQYRTYWVSGDAKYNFKKYFLLKDSLYPFMEDAFDKIQKSDFLLTLQLNGARIFSVRKNILLQGSLAYTFALNSNNYEKLDEVKVSKDVSILDSANHGIRVSSDETSGRKGDLKFSNGHILTGEVHFIATPNKSNVGIDLFTRPAYTINKDSKILNLRAGINFSIKNSSKDNPLINVGIAVDFKDIARGYADKADALKRIIPSLMLGVPFPKIPGV
jgi:hypothetical protein